MGSMIDFKRPDGSTCKGYLAEAGNGKPGQGDGRKADRRAAKQRKRHLSGNSPGQAA